MTNKPDVSAEVDLHIAEVTVSKDDLDMGFSEALIAGKIKLPDGIHKLYTYATVKAAIASLSLSPTEPMAWPDAENPRHDRDYAEYEQASQPVAMQEAQEPESEYDRMKRQKDAILLGERLKHCTCDECGKSKAEGWALYCVSCSEILRTPAEQAKISVEQIEKAELRLLLNRRRTKSLEGDPNFYDGVRWAESICVSPAPAAPTEPPNETQQATKLEPDEICQLVGVRADGTEVDLGPAPMPPMMKAKDIVRSYFGSDFDDEMSEESMALQCCRELLDFMKRAEQAAPKAEQAVRGSDSVAEVVMTAKMPNASPAWRPHKIINASLAWLDANPVGTKLYALPVQQANSTPGADELHTAVLDAWASYQRFGEVCPFEGNPMIYASVLEDLHEIAARDAQGKS